MQTRVLLHHDDKMSFPPCRDWRSQVHFDLLVVVFLHAVKVGSPLHGVSFGKRKRPWRASVSIVSMVEVSVVCDRVTAFACIVHGLETYAK